ncbi:MAG: hypothetical protein HY951_12435 [Bacteroidia bacterium]|nr:hypothetical protein [Bacteroidia bacterium]
MKFYNKISVIIISIILILSSTGILLIHHHCDHCKTDDWHLFSSINCKGDIFEPECCSENENKHCSDSECTDITEETPCCSNDGLFFKIGLFNSCNEISDIHFQTEIDIISNNEIFIEKLKSSSDFIFSDNSPPKLFKQIYLINNSFLI